MEFENLLRLVECVSGSNLDSFYYEQNGTRIKLKKSGGAVRIEAPAPKKEEPQIQPENTEKTEASGSATQIKSPLVGVFYEAPGEGAKPFVSVGDRVKKGQILGIIEAMKLMNEIESECDGIVKEISVKDGQAVEYGQTLFVLEN